MTEYFAAALTTRGIRRDDSSAIAAFFDAAGCACNCQYWRFGGTKNEWLDTLATGGSQNRAALHAQMLADELHGVIALQNERIVGWMQVTPKRYIPKLLRQSVYRTLTIFDENAWSIGCLLVLPALRKRGVAAALLAAAVEYARAHAASAIEAYPRDADRELYDEEAFMGPASIYRHAGFVHVGGELPYPVLRRTFDERATRETTPK
jgi:GNAT superfamily N-acetyltransferase